MGGRLNEAMEVTAIIFNDLVHHWNVNNGMCKRGKTDGHTEH